MKQNFYQYSILKYRPSLLLDEQVAIGLLFVFLEDRRVEFIFPNHLTRRLTTLYPNTNVNLLKTHLKAFERRATELSSKPLYVEGILPSLIETEFLQTDANSLFFTPFKVGSYQNADATLEYYRQEFFALYDNVEDEKHGSDRGCKCKCKNPESPRDCQHRNMQRQNTPDCPVVCGITRKVRQNESEDEQNCRYN